MIRPSRSAAQPAAERVATATPRPLALFTRQRPRTREQQAFDLAQQITDAQRFRQRYCELAGDADGERREHLLRRAAAQQVREGKARRRLAKLAPQKVNDTLNIAGSGEERRND